MGKIINHILIFSIAVLSCQTSQAKITRLDLMKYESWEYNNHILLEKNLNKKLQLFFEKKTDSFINNEYGIVNSYKLMVQAIYMSQEEYTTLFFHKFLAYYKTTDLQNELNTIIRQYEKELYIQRCKIFNKSRKNLSKKIKISELPTIRISSKSPVERTKNELTDELIGIISDRIPIIVSLIFTVLGIISSPGTKFGGVIISIASLIYFSYKGYVYDNEMKEQLLAQSEEYIKENQIEIKKQLNNETKEFYKNMGLK